ncbi:ABC transporter ATP-binding protein [Pararhodobacter sp.]|uniref:ABC transporter ATP-binding protein n=1 Tax=Pararhodobacter sp. TaxID=2127056 RepID=UPI002FDE5000
MLTVTDLCVRLGRAPVLNGVSAAFAPGRLTALVGPNGCGKSTLLRAIMGLIPVQGGAVTLDGAPLSRLTRRQLARAVAWLPQASHCPDYLTLGELVEMGAHARQGWFRPADAPRRTEFAEALRIVGLEAEAARAVNTLSGGQRQRAFIAMALAQQAPTLLLDEPVNHLDTRYQIAILALLRRLAHEQGRRVVVVLHDLNLATGFADDAVLMAAGRVLAQGPVAGVITPARVAECFGIEAEVFRRGERLVCLPAIPADTPEQQGA